MNNIAIIAKHRILAIGLLVLTLGGSAAALRSVGGTWEASATLVLIVPAQLSPEENIFLGLDGSAQVIPQVVARRVRSAAVVAQMVAAGADEGYAVSADASYSAPTLTVVAHHRDPAVAMRTVTLVTDEIQSEIAALQREAGAPPRTFLTAEALFDTPTPRAVPGSRKRALGALVVASLALTFGGVLLAAAVGRLRDRRRTAAWEMPGAPPWLALARYHTGEPAMSPEGPRRSFDAAACLTVFVVLLLAIPARLIVKPIGAAGTPATMFGILMLLWWACHRLLPKRAAILFQPVRFALQLFGVAVLISYAGGFFRSIDIVEILSADRGLISLAAWSGIALIAADGIASRARLRVLLERVVNAVAWLAALGLVQFFASFDIRSWYRIPGLTVNGALVLIQDRAGFNRVAGTTDHPIEFGVILAMVLPLALHFGFHAVPTRRGVAWLRVALIGVAIPVSVSRAGVLGLVVGLAVLFASWPAQRRRRALLLAPAILVGMRLMVPGLLGSIRGMFLGIQSDASFTGRTDDYTVATQYFLQSPLIGRGWGTFLPYRYDLLDNQYLGTLMEAGLLGLFALCALFAIGICTARGAYHRCTDIEGRDLSQALVASLIVAMISIATFDAFSFSMFSGMLFLLLGCVGSLWRLTIADQLEHVADPTNKAVRSSEARV